MVRAESSWAVIVSPSGEFSCFQHRQTERRKKWGVWKAFKKYTNLENLQPSTALGIQLRITVNGTVSWGFFTTGFFSIKHHLLGPCFTSKSVFAYDLKFADIFKFEIDSKVSMTMTLIPNKSDSETFWYWTFQIRTYQIRIYQIHQIRTY